MKCSKKGCNEQACASFSEKILDVNSTNNQWATAEPTYKRISWYFCSKHINEKVEELSIRQM